MEKSLLDSSPITEVWLDNHFEKSDSGNYHGASLVYELWIMRNSNTEWNADLYVYSPTETKEYHEVLNTVGQLRAFMRPVEPELPF